MYEVWQKSYETDFLLSMNFILFTYQGYPLQNSSLGQLHCDGGVVSIVRSSALGTCHPLPESFKDFPIISLIDSLSWWHKFLVDDPLTVKKTN